MSTQTNSEKKLKHCSQNRSSPRLTRGFAFVAQKQCLSEQYGLSGRTNSEEILGLNSLGKSKTDTAEKRCQFQKYELSRANQKNFAKRFYFVFMS
jgi:hypothetical protein